MEHFWNGFTKHAGTLGVKALQPLAASGNMVGNKPTSGVSTGSAFKPNPLPTSKPISAVKNTTAALPEHKTPAMPKPISMKASTHI